MRASSGAVAPDVGVGPDSGYGAAQGQDLSSLVRLECRVPIKRFREANENLVSCPTKRLEAPTCRIYFRDSTLGRIVQKSVRVAWQEPEAPTGLGLANITNC